MKRNGMMTAFALALAVASRAQDCNHACPAAQRDARGCCPAARPPARPRPASAAAPVPQNSTRKGFALTGELVLPEATGYTLDFDPGRGLIVVSGGASFSPEQLTLVIDRRTLAVRARLRGSGAHLDAGAGRLYAARLSPSAVIAYDLATFKTVWEAPVEGCAIFAIPDPARSLVWAASQCGANDDALTAVSAADGRAQPPIGSGGVLGTVYVQPVTGQVFIGPGGYTREIDIDGRRMTERRLPGRILAVDPRTPRIYTTTGGRTAIVDARSGQVVGEFPPLGAVAADPDRDRLYGALLSGRGVRAYNAEGTRLLGEWPLPGGFGITALAADPDGGDIFVVARGAETVKLFVLKFN